MIAYKKRVRKVLQNVKRAKSNVLLVVPFCRFVFVIVIVIVIVMVALHYRVYWIGFGPTPQLFRIELLFTHKNGDFARLNFQKKILGPAGPQVFIFVARTSILVAKNYI